MFIPPNLEPCTPAVRAGALSAGEEDMRRCARLRELDSDESEWTRVERDGYGVNGTTGSGGCGFSRVVEEDEPVEDLVAVRLVRTGHQAIPRQPPPSSNRLYEAPTRSPR